jgi:hypothetical protein
MMESRVFPGALKRSFPRMNAGAPTTNSEVCSSHADSKDPEYETPNVVGVWMSQDEELV